MGTDNLFHKRKARTASDLARRKALRSPYAKVLIVCEGEKTEPNYFNNLKDHYGLNSANIEIAGECGSAPGSILRYARQRYREEKDAGDAFDQVFCVFDKDSHPGYQQTIDDIERATPNNTYKAITSVPCFEYWLLLHFIYTTSPYSALPGNSACHQVLTEFRGYMPDYAKSDEILFDKLIDQLDIAKYNAMRAAKAARQIGTDNPTTQIHELVDFLQNIKN